MLFLRKMIANGFKSFATKTEINFIHPMSGIVGPNGSGKSNIVDAVKWVLGEQSNKNLRSKISSDIIFHGSKEHLQSKSAEITLVFDNTSKVLHHTSKQISITRKLTRGDGSNEYFINNEQCRLKDIQDIFLDTGLSKGSLGIISQGTVQWFVEAKPEDRRIIFEDAAGIGLYSKKRNEANRQFQKTEENLNRIMDITLELKNSLNKLQKQADKAKIYAEKQKELKHLDLSIMVKDLKHFTDREQIINKQINEAKEKLMVYEPKIKELAQSLAFYKEKETMSDKKIDDLTKEFNDIIGTINKLEIKKSSLNSQLKIDLQSENINKKIDAYKNLIGSAKYSLDDAKDNIEKLNDSISTFQEIINQFQGKKKSLLIVLEDKTSKVIETRTKIKQLVDTLDSKSSFSEGVRAIMNNKQALVGIKGLVQDFIEVDDKYAHAIKTGLGQATNNIIVETEEDAQEAINFLKQNKAGKATFLPIDSIKEKFLKPEYIDALSPQEGFIGIASDLIEFDKKYKKIINFLLGNVIIANEIEDAFMLSKLTYQLYRVITLDGDIVYPGGSVSGGFNNKKHLPLNSNPQKLLEELNILYPTLNNECGELKLQLEKISTELNENINKQSEKKILLSRYEETLRVNENQLLKYEADYNQLLVSNDVVETKSEWTSESVDKEILRFEIKKNKFNEDINVSRQSKLSCKSQITDSENKLNEIRYQVDSARDIVSKHENEKIKCETILENAKTKINQTYQMTVDFVIETYSKELPISDFQAREAIATIQAELSRIGPINMEALNELEINQKRYDELYAQQEELDAAKTIIEEVINELDKKAKTSFTNAIDGINKILPDVFKHLFGGGTCKVEYTDPDNVLTSGIDVTVEPFGKNVTRLSLLSGGEKSLVALSILFAILKINTFPLVILDEAESALDPANVERFANMILEASKNTQFVVITHRPGTMERCDELFGATMQTKGVTSIYQVTINQAQKYGHNKVKA